MFLDLGMPNLNGYELARMFRKSYRDAPLRLVAVTAYGTPEDRALSRASGFDAHVQKPVDIPMVEAMLATLFGRLAAFLAGFIPSGPPEWAYCSISEDARRFDLEGTLREDRVRG